jgi:hypothetical protein
MPGRFCLAVFAEAAQRGGTMNQSIRPSLVVGIALAATAVLTGCGGGAKPTEMSTSHSVDPTDKGAKPGAGNNFSPTAVAPLTKS